jgi:uncharacterized protein YndB with AHSA1/START domain
MSGRADWSWSSSGISRRPGIESSERLPSLRSWRRGGVRTDSQPPEIDLDLRVGGRYRFTMQPPNGEPFHLSGEFLTIDAPSRLAYSFRWEEPDPDDQTTVVTLSLLEVGQATELSLRQGQFATEARLALHRDGWTDSFNKLRELLKPDSGGKA